MSESPIIYTTNGFVILNGHKIAVVTGIFFTEKEAVDNYKVGEAVAELYADCRLPNHVGEFNKFYYPHSETWESSHLYKIQQQACTDTVRALAKITGGAKSG